jgi:hypothetical protein
MTKAAKGILPILGSVLLSCGLFCQQGLGQTVSSVGNITFAGSINLDTSSAAACAVSKLKRVVRWVANRGIDGLPFLVFSS